jgi:Zn-dependent metalloprotease
VGPIDPEGVERLLDDTGGSAIIRHHRATGAVRFARFVPGSLTLRAPRGANPEEKAKAFFDQYGSTFGLSDFARELAPAGRRTDHHGFTHLAYRQVYRGVPVFAGVLLVHFDPAGRLSVVNGTFLPRLTLSTRPAWSRERAAEVAMSTVEGQQRQQGGPTSSATEPLTAAGSMLFVFRAGLTQGIPGPVHLVWEIEVVSVEPGVREFVYVDAHNGKVVDQITGIHDAMDREVYQINLGNLVWEEGDTDPIPNPWAGENDPVVLEDWQDEIDGAKEVYHLFRHITNGSWLSYDGIDATLKSINLGTNCSNAWWDSTAANFCNGVTGDDIVTHEWGHAYTEESHGLIYQWQPGALNEAYSDMWGETVDLLNGRGKDAPGVLRTANTCSDYGSGFPKGDDTYRWLMGEDADEPGGFGGAIRDMWRPVCYGDAGKVSDGQYHCSSSDSGGVHSNSGVPNHAFALLTDGGDYNGQTIAALGLTKTTNLFWRAGSIYQVPTTDFVDHADALEASCTDLIGVTPLYEPKTDNTTPSDSGEVFDATDCAQVTKVIAAVELRTEPTQCNFSPLLDPDAPALCVDVGSPVTLSFTDWESGLGSWTADTRAVANPATFDTPDWAAVGSLPGDRPRQAAFVIDDPALGDCLTDDESGVLFLESPAIAIPGGADSPWIAFHHWVATETDSSGNWDGGNLKISVNGGDWTLVPSGAFTFNAYNANLSIAGNTNPLAGESAFTGSDGGAVTGTWGESQLALTGIAAAGDTIRLRLEMGLDGCNGLVGWYVDDLRVYSCPCVDDLVFENETLSGKQFHMADQTITAGPNLVIDGESIELAAGQTIIFANGVEIGGSFSAGAPKPCPQ